MEVRSYQPDDWPDVERLCRSEAYYDSVFLEKDRLREASVQQLSENIPKLDESPDGKLLVALHEHQMVGYVALVLNTKESITMETQSLIADASAVSFEALELLVKEARKLTVAAKNLYMVTHIQKQHKRMQLWFYRLGFRAELNRTVRSIPAGFVGASSSRYVPRPAIGPDSLFIVRVNTAYSGSYRPTGRDVDLTTVSIGFMAAYANLNWNDKNWHYTILHDTQTNTAAGYIMLQESWLRAPQKAGYYTYDVAVAPEFSGRGLSLYLCGAAESLVGRRGGGFLYGDSNVDNLAVVNGDVQLGYAIDSIRFGCDCRSQS